MHSLLPPLILIFSMAFLGELVVTSLSAAPNRVFCYGDSLTAGTAPPDPSLYPYAPHLESSLKNVFVRHRGLPGWTSSQMVEASNDATTGITPAVRAGMPLKLVIILAGTNDLAFTDDASIILNNILALHQLCYNEGVPKTCAIGIPPSGYQSMNANAAALAQAVNDKLKEYCDSEPKATFVPFPFEYDPNSGLWALDGLHLSPEGYRVLGESLAPAVKPILKESNSEID
jgi:lysophospholipase L1-like esterase